MRVTTFVDIPISFSVSQRLEEVIKVEKKELDGSFSVFHVVTLARRGGIIVESSMKGWYEFQFPGCEAVRLRENEMLVLKYEPKLDQYGNVVLCPRFRQGRGKFFCERSSFAFASMLGVPPVRTLSSIIELDIQQ